MGVDTSFRCVYGVKLDWNQELSDAHDEIYDTCQTPFTFELYGGEWIMVGEKYFDSGSSRWGTVEDQFVELDIDRMQMEWENIKATFAKEFPDFAHLLDSREPKVMAFIHYT